MDDQDIQEPESEDEELMDDLEMAEADSPAAVTAGTPDFETEYEEEAAAEVTANEKTEENVDETAGATADELTEETTDESALEATFSPTPAPDTADIVRDIEAILFIAPDPVSLEVLAEVTGTEGEALSHAVESVREKYSDTDGGIVFAEIVSGYTFRTGDFAREAVERFCRRPIDYSLSSAAMETLAIVAYLQPITRPEIARIRGVGAPIRWSPTCWTRGWWRRLGAPSRLVRSSTAPRRRSRSCSGWLRRPTCLRWRASRPRRPMSRSCAKSCIWPLISGSRSVEAGFILDRLQKFLARSGIASRRKCEELILLKPGDDQR